MKIIIMIPARLGSQRLKEKNLALIDEKSILQIAAEKAMATKGISQIWINTESDLLGNIAKQVGVNFHKRPMTLANNQATSEEFVYEFLLKHECDYLIQLHSIAPLLSQRDIQGFIDYLVEKKPEVLLSYEPIQIECTLKDSPVNFSYSEKTNSQELEPIKRISWSITAWKSSLFISSYELGKCATYSGQIDYYPVNKMASHVIKTQEDLDIARALYELYNTQSNIK